MGMSRKDQYLYWKDEPQKHMCDSPSEAADLDLLGYNLVEPKTISHDD